MKKILRFIICYAVSFGALFLCGYSNLMYFISPPLAAYTFCASAFVFAIIIWGILEIHLNIKQKILELSKRIEHLENEND